MGLAPRVVLALAEHGIQNLMRHLGMLEGAEEPNHGVVWLEDYWVVSRIAGPELRDRTPSQ